ncbi:hypothetical protein INS49_005138 [Diaporthe citri]|uniref:uncharacterized protein n=1 Tax=Diaporthe citri TaxID=83186 RepID=UPI001C80AD2A|nr:uncharacterized protein INS49_005138 [Diaporthe citri]KAG6353881.1 hypothetical protein INS49_005138 [Diaporthe citri]
MGWEMKSLRLSQLFVQAGDSAVRPNKTGKTDHVVEAGLAEEPRATRVNRRGTGCGEPATTAADGPTAAAKIPPWNPIERYWSDKNSFPDYGKPGDANMNDRLKKLSQSFAFGNWLNGPIPQPEAPAKTQKRLNDFAHENTPKRPRTEDDTGHDIRSTPSSSGLPERSVAASSAQRKGAHDALSLRSSADRSANGKGLEEYRSTEHRGGIRKSTRPRRRDKARRSSGGLADGASEACLQKTNLSARYKSRNNLLSLRKPSDDPIQDDEELEVTNGPVARASVINGRANAKTATGNAVYTASKFTSVDESDDELSADQPAHVNPRSQRQTGSVSQATNGRKRPTEIVIDEESQILPAAKRRTQSSNRADMRRTNFASGAARVGDDCGGLQVIKAVCEPTYVYPADGGMHGDLKGASNKSCLLISRTDVNSPFEAVDAVSREPIPDLEWLTPKISKVTQISCARNSMVVKIVKSSDTTAVLKTGAVMFLQFRNAHQEQFVTRCCKIRGIDARDNMAIGTLVKEMDHKIEQIAAYNEAKAKEVADTDVQYLEHKESTTNRSNPKSSVRLARPVTSSSQQAVDKRPIRQQMRTDASALAEGKTQPKVLAHGATSMTPEQVKQLREDFGDESQSEYQPRRIVRNEEKWQTPSRAGTSQPELRSQRNLRSAGPKPKSPSPAVERWTDKHPNWADDWKIDLVYERTVVGKSDVERLDEGQLLNDEIITFYIKFLHKQLEDRDEQLAKKVYCFNSFFWEKLKPKRGTVNYEGVKNWTAKVDLLSFDYIIVPINEHAHWYVAIICNARELLSSQETASEADEPGLDKPQDEAEAVREDEVSEVSANDTMKKIAVDVSHISIEDEPAETASKQQEDRRTAAAKKTKAPKKGNQRKYDPKATRVITLDSLDGTHSAVSTALKIYLQHEIEAKKGLRVEAPATIGMSARDIPTQPNFTDCGVYLLGYMREFMKDPDRFATNILQREERTWNFDAPTLRSEIRDLIFKLQKEYQQDQERMRRERAQVKRQKLKQQGLATTTGLPSRSSDEPPFRQSPAPPPGSAANSRQATPVQAERSFSRPAVDQDIRPAHEEPQAHLPQPTAGDKSVNINNVSMIVNVDESIEETKAHSPSITPASKPVDSIELDSGDDAPEQPAARGTPSTGHTPQNASTRTATPGTAYDDRKFLPPLSSSSAKSSPGKAEPSKRSANREGLDVVKTANSHLGSRYARKLGTAKSKVTKSEVIPSSSEEEAGGKEVKKKKKKKKKSPTIDLTLE